MRMIRRSLLAGLAILCAPALGAEPPEVPSGRYEGPGFSLEFEQDRLFVSADGQERTQTRFLVKGNQILVAPIVPPGQKMTRNVWVVYTIFEDRLESSHVADMDTGETFYPDGQPKIVLRKRPA